MDENAKGLFGPVSDELLGLVAAACDGAITPDGARRLESLLRDNPRAQPFYVAYLDLHSRLLWRYRGDRAALVPATLGEGQGEGATSPLTMGDGQSDATGATARSSLLQDLQSKGGQAADAGHSASVPRPKSGRFAARKGKGRVRPFSRMRAYFRTVVRRTKRKVGELRFNMALAFVFSLLFAGAVAGTGAIISAIVLSRARPADQPEVAQSSTRPIVSGPDMAPGEAANEDADEEPSPLMPPGQPVVNPVARLARTVDCAWAGDRDADPLRGCPEAGDDLAAGQRLALKSGLAEVVFQGGARTILQGPAVLEVRSRASAVLNRGKCTVTAEDPRAHGFEIHSRGMKYTDLGTEFGVVVAENGVQEVHVFRGKVQAEQSKEQGAGSRERAADGHGSALPAGYPLGGSLLVLTANQAIRIAAPDKSGKPSKPIQPVAADEKQFVRALPPATALDLVDIVAGGDGLSARRNRGINPTNGRFGDEPNGRDNIVTGLGTVFRADHQYHRVPSSPLIDGVFIVHGGRGPVQLDSAGHSFAGFPDNDGRTANMIQSAGATPARRAALFSAKQDNLPQLGGVDYSSIGHGVLSIRSNKGITFDLMAIRAAHPGYRLLSFAAVAGNSCRLNRERHLGDFWVFVDGQLRFKRPNVSIEDGAIPIDMPLQPADRYLTLVATTTTSSGIWNWTMFGDPALKLAAIETSPTDTNKTK